MGLVKYMSLLTMDSRRNLSILAAMYSFLSAMEDTVENLQPLSFIQLVSRMPRIGQPTTFSKTSPR